MSEKSAAASAARPSTPRWSERYPELGTGPVPIDPYVSEEHFELEKKYLFGRAWLHVGRIEEVPNPGDFFTKDLDAPNVTLIVVRGNDGKVRAFHNVCAHRCNRVAWEPSGCTKRFKCKFHGWTYDLNGRLIGLPDRSQFHPIRDEEYGLTPVNCETWEGFIFINLDPTPQETLKEFLGEHFQKIEGYPFEHMKSVFGWEAVVNCNWKVALDGFQEAYHVAFVHGLSVHDKLAAPDNRLIHPLKIELEGHHRKLSLPGNLSSVYGNPSAANDEKRASMIQTSKPIEAAASRFGVPAMKEATAAFAGKPLPEGMNPSKSPIWLFDINVLFPDFYLSMRPNYYMAYNFRPVSVNKMRFEARVYYPRTNTAGGRFYQEYMKCLLRDVVLEDWGTMERVQRALGTRAKTHMVMQENEILVRHLYEHSIDYIRRQQARDVATHNQGGGK